MLALDDPRWKAWTQPVAWFTQWLKRLLEKPNDLGLFYEDCYKLCSDEVTWSVAFAAAPYLVELARRAEPAARIQYIRFLGSIVMYRVPAGDVEPQSDCPPDLEAEFQTSVASALEMATALLLAAEAEADVRRLLAAIAAFKGFNDLARGIVDLAHDDRNEPPVEDIPF
jgi:hypothetical protein